MAEIEYFYASFSGYAYLGSKRLMEIAKLIGSYHKTSTV